MCTKFLIAYHFFSLELRCSIFCTRVGTVTRHILGYFRINFPIDKVAKFCDKVLTLQEGMKFRSQKIHRHVPQSFLNLKMMLLFHLQSPKLRNRPIQGADWRFFSPQPKTENFISGCILKPQEHQSISTSIIATYCHGTNF